MFKKENSELMYKNERDDIINDIVACDGMIKLN